MLRRPAAARALGRRPVRLVAPDVTPGARAAWEAAVARYQRACGCSTGAAFALGAAALVVLSAMVEGGPLSVAAVLRAALHVIIATFVMGLVGKLVGLAAARARFRRACARVLRNAAEHASEHATGHAAAAG